MKRLKRYRAWVVMAAVLLIVYVFILPRQLFNDPYSTVLEDAAGELLGATIAGDGQWRFPEIQTLPQKFETALLTYEDKRFRNHPGVDLLSMARALRQNLSAGKVVSGGSTITMQVIRLSRQGKARTVFQKGLEMILATRLEWRCSKDEILRLYASHAPFGGNVVGLEAACWRYFGRDPQELSWGEAALLAVLPNAPSLMHPGKNRDRLKAKRDILLATLQAQGIIDAFTCSLAQDEPIPGAPQPLPRVAPHLLARVAREGWKGHKVKTTVQADLQARVEQLVSEHHQRLASNQVFNAAAVVADVRTGNVLAYVGNTENKSAGNYSDAVDVVTAPRSTGSILKPFLFAAMLDEGKILPHTLVPDVPTFINGFSPKNFSHGYDGVVPADKALIRSLNIPAVHLLRNYRYEKFHTLLGNIGFTTLTKSADHYGLALILGGAEGTLWDITGIYASMARTLTGYFNHPGSNRYDRRDFHALRYLADTVAQKPEPEATSWLSAAAIYQTFDALKEVYRPGEETGWRYFNSAKKIAWKTGTSFGFRDGWAIGVTPDYVVGVWVGNADGEGRPGLTGTDAAAPLMFDIFSQLDGQRWFELPRMEMEQITVCAASGHRNTAQCHDVDTAWVVKQGLQSAACPYHKTVYLTKDKKFRVHHSCSPADGMVETQWFVLPPTQEYFFKAHALTYHALPPFRKDCETASGMAMMDLIYPKPGARIFIPRDLDGTLGSAVFELAHRNASALVYWHLDGAYIGSTRRNHKLPLRLGEGRHVLTLVDEDGESVEQSFEVLSKM